MGARILVADDSVTIQKVVALTFSREDFELIPARSGEEAIRKAKESRPDLMLIDLVMPDKNGYEVCRTLREDPQLKATPIVLLAGTFETFDKGEGIKVGANDFVTKPFESQTLISKVKQLLSAKTVPLPVEPVRPWPAEAPPAVPPFRPVAPAPAMPAMAAAPPPAPPPPPTLVTAPALEPVFELGEDLLAAPAAGPPPRTAVPPAPSAPAMGTTIQLSPPPAPPPTPAVAPPAPELVELQELSLDDLTAEEPLASVDLVAIDLEVPEAVTAAPAAREAALPPSPGELDFDFASVPPAEPVAAEAPAEAAPMILHGTFAEMELDVGRPPAAPPLEPAPAMDLAARHQEPPPAAEPEGLPPLSTEELLRELETTMPAPDFPEPAAPPADLAVFLEPAPPPPLAPPEAALVAAEPAQAEPVEAPPMEALIPPFPVLAAPPPAVAPLVVEPAAPAPPLVVEFPIAVPALEAIPVPAAPPEPVAAIPAAVSADMAARLAAELAPYLTREIVDKIMERIERVVWEVVPDLAEAMIQRELDRIKERAERRSAR